MRTYAISVYLAATTRPKDNTVEVLAPHAYPTTSPGVLLAKVFQTTVAMRSSGRRASVRGCMAKSGLHGGRSKASEINAGT